MNNIAMDICDQVLCGHAFLSSEYISKSKIGSYGNSMLINSAINEERLTFLHILFKTYYLSFDYSHPIVSGKQYLIIVLICFPLMVLDVKHLFIFLLAIPILLIASFTQQCLQIKPCQCPWLLTHHVAVFHGVNVS